MDHHRGARATLTAVLVVYGFACLRSPESWRLLDNVNLAIHETGHMVFMAFGETMMFLGGTLLQLILPLAFVVSFVRRGDQHAASVALWWVAQNCWNISVYVADARAQLLPLVGGGEHDWFNLLYGWDLLHRDKGIAAGIHATGVVIFILASIWGVWSLRPRPEEAPAAAGSSLTPCPPPPAIRCRPANSAGRR